MNDNEKEELFLTVAKIKREEFINSEEYASFLLRIFTQLLNLDSSHYKPKDCTEYKPNIELLSIYKDYLTINEEKFQNRDIVKLRQSLDDSLYASIEPGLLPFKLKKLISNDVDSFLILPLTTAFYFKDQKSFRLHEIGVIAKRKENMIQIEIIDKSTISIESRKNVCDHVYSSHIYQDKKGIVSYIYEIEETKVLELAKILYLGLINPKKQVSDMVDLDGYKQEVILTKLSEMAINEYYGERVGTYQYLLGNCLAKELEASIKFSLGQERYSILSKIKTNYKGSGAQATFLREVKLPHTKSSKEIYLDLTAILLDRFEQLNFNKEVYTPCIIDMFNTYLYLKNCRAKDTFKKKLQTVLSRPVFEKMNYHVPKISESHICAEKLNPDFKNIDLLKKELAQISYYPHALTMMKKEIHKNKEYSKKTMFDALHK